MMIQPSMATWVVVICGILGICSLGIYPIMLELSVECTYPLDESVVTGLCYLSSAIQVCRTSLALACRYFLFTIITFSVPGITTYVYREFFQHSFDKRGRS